MNVDDFLDAVAGEDMGQGGEYAFCVEAVRKVFEHYFPNGAMDAGILGPLGEEEFSPAARQRDRQMLYRQMLWESVYASVAGRPYDSRDGRNPAAEADVALREWDRRWSKEGS